MTKIKIQAHHLQAGDIVGSSEEIVYVGHGASTSAGNGEETL